MNEMLASVVCVCVCVCVRVCVCVHAHRYGVSVLVLVNKKLEFWMQFYLPILPPELW